MNAVRVVARRQVRSLMLAAGVRSCVPAFTASPSMQLRTVKQASAKMAAAKAKKAVLLKQKKAAEKPKLALKAKALKAGNAPKNVQYEEGAAARKASLEEKRSPSGPVNPFNLFVQQTTSGNKGNKIDLKKVAAEWKALGEGQKQKYRDQAKKNLSKRRATRQSMKKSPSKYALFTKQHFPAEYTAARKNTTNHNDAFKAAVRAVSKKYKSQ